GKLTRLPRQAPNLYEDGRWAVAGAPFALPYTLNLPAFERERWRLHLDLIEATRKLAAVIPPDDEGSSAILKRMKEDDQAAGAVIGKAMAQPEKDCSQQRARAPSGSPRFLKTIPKGAKRSGR